MSSSSTIDAGRLYQLLGETRATFNRSIVSPGPAPKTQPSGTGAAGAAAVFNCPAPVNNDRRRHPPLISLPAGSQLSNAQVLQANQHAAPPASLLSVEASTPRHLFRTFFNVLLHRFTFPPLPAVPPQVSRTSIPISRNS
jgi:hypothetical protein